MTLLLQPTPAPPKAEDVLMEVALAAEAAGLCIETLTYLHNKQRQTRLRMLKLNGHVYTIQIVDNAQSRPNRRQVSAHTGAHEHSLKECMGTIFYVCAPGYQVRMLVVPNDKLLAAFKPCVDGRLGFMIPLEYRPEHPVFDFLAYEDAWDLVPAAQTTTAA